MLISLCKNNQTTTDFKMVAIFRAWYNGSYTMAAAKPLNQIPGIALYMQWSSFSSVLIVEQQIISFNFQDVCMKDLVTDFAEM